MFRHAAVVVLVACSSPEDPIDLATEAPGPNRVGTARFEIHDAARARDLVAQAWYPTTTAPSDVAIESLEIEPIRTRYSDLLATAPACPARTLPVAVDAPAQSGLPVVMISHCHSCTRLSNATTAIRLASHGFAVVSVEHAGDTLWETLDGMEADIDREELEVRTADIRVALDQVIAGGTPVGAVDAARVGVLGHSMGAVTTGRVAETDPRIGAAAALCAPMENPFVPGVTLAAITTPVMFVVAVEDNSITEFGNQFIRDNFTEATVPAVKLEIPDAGHWSVSDLDGLVEAFAPGCGDAERQTDGEPFTYLDPDTGRAIAASYATAFFKAKLQDDALAARYLESASGSFGVKLSVEAK
jgi:predicted dienelactone hydrolase